MSPTTWWLGAGLMFVLSFVAFIVGVELKPWTRLWRRVRR